jgi:hypothetical protein
MKGMIYIIKYFPLVFSLLLAHCVKDPALNGDSTVRRANFTGPEIAGEIENIQLNEVSGIVYSRKNPGLIWAHNDSGDKARLFLLDTIGRHMGTFLLAGAKNRDWEDIAIGPGPETGKQYLYIGDIGDNLAVKATKTIYRIPEPDLSGITLPLDTVLTGAEALIFRIPDGPKDSEAFIVDPLTKDIYIISKREPMVSVYVMRFPQLLTAVNILEFVNTIDITQVTAADISPSGEELLIKTYSDIYYWLREKNEPLSETIKRAPKRLRYEQEFQGEAVAWKADASGYFTLGEKQRANPLFLYFYRRK